MTFRSIEGDGEDGIETPLYANEEEEIHWGDVDPPQVSLDDCSAIIAASEVFARIERGGGGFFFALKGLGTTVNGGDDLSSNSNGFVLAATLIIGVVSCDFTDGYVVSFVDGTVDMNGGDEVDVSGCGDIRSRIQIHEKRRLRGEKIVCTPLFIFEGVVGAETWVPLRLKSSTENSALWDDEAKRISYKLIGKKEQKCRSPVITSVLGSRFEPEDVS